MRLTDARAAAAGDTFVFMRASVDANNLFKFWLPSMFVATSVFSMLE